MSKPCIVAFCKNIGTHHIPKNEILKTQWLEAIEHIKPGMTLTVNAVICSAHFRRIDFAVTPSYWKNYHHARRILKKNTIPSVFPWNKASQEEPSPLIQDSLSFDPTKVKASYSRIQPIAFVEEQHFLATAATDLLGDPLQSSDHESESNLDQINSFDDHIIECEFGIDNNDQEEIFQEEQQHETKQLHDKSVQTTDAKTPDNNLSCGFSLHYYKDDDKSLHFYTGLENFDKIKLVFYTLGNSVFKLNYFYGKPPKKIEELEQFFITLIILRRHKTFEEVTMLYKITLKHVLSIFITWIRFMSLQWKNLELWIDKERIKAYMPLDFYDQYPETRVVLDATECPVKKSKLPLAQQVTFSSYKNRNTVKVLIGITPSGLISYVSPSYGGSATDRQIIERSSVLDKFDYNDEIMVDKGLNVQDIFIPYGVKVNMPAFFKKGNQIASTTLTSNRKVASKRVHVERIIGMLKTYKILNEPMNQTETLLSGDIIFICAMLVNFRSNIISKNA